MFRYFILFIIVGLALTLPACEDAVTREFEVSHDCTGSYLLQPGGDLKVCNKEILEPFSSGDFIDATLRFRVKRNVLRLTIFYASFITLIAQ